MQPDPKPLGQQENGRQSPYFHHPNTHTHTHTVGRHPEHASGLRVTEPSYNKGLSEQEGPRNKMAPFYWEVKIMEVPSGLIPL